MTATATRSRRRAPTKAPDDNAYYSAAATKDLLAGSIEWRLKRLAAGDMLSTDDAAKLLGTNRVTINNWIRDRRYFAVEGPTRGWKLPRWQFQPPVCDDLSKILDVLDADESGWLTLLFLETPAAALDGRTPRQALEQGEVKRVVQLAQAYATADV